MTTALPTSPSALLAGLPARRGFGDATLIRLAPGSVDLGGGNPAADLLPIDVYQDAFLSVTRSEAFPRLLKYSPAPGLPSLRETIAVREGVTADRILITNGGAHGLALAALGTFDPGDVVVVDDPVYPLFLRVLDLIGVSVVPLPVTADGIDTEELERRLRAGLRPRALFTVPTFQNPSGVTLSPEREASLVALAEKFGFTIIADDPYRDIAFPGTVVPERSAFRASDNVLAVNTFSKTLGPGLRLGWMVLPTGASDRYTRLRNRLDGQTSGVLQAVVEEMLADDRLAPSIVAAGEVYARKARALTDALREAFEDAVEIADPTGGFFTWARFSGDVDFAALFEAAQDRGVTYQRGEWFAAEGEGFRGFARLSFSDVSIEDLRTGVSRLALAWRGLGGRGGRAVHSP